MSDDTENVRSLDVFKDGWVAFSNKGSKVILKSLTAATFTCLAVKCFSANPLSQSGHMIETHLRLNWTLDYSNPLKCVLSNDIKLISQSRINAIVYLFNTVMVF